MTETTSKWANIYRKLLLEQIKMDLTHVPNAMAARTGDRINIRTYNFTATNIPKSDDLQQEKKNRSLEIPVSEYIKVFFK